MKSLLQKNGCITSTDPVVTSSNKACSTISPTRKPKSRASSSIPTQLIICGLTMFGLIGLSGCGSLTNSTSSNTDSTDQITVLSFSITPDKTSYTAGETVTINCTKTGPEDVGAAWSYSLKGGTLKNPTTTTSNFVVTVGGSGFNMVVTGNPTKRRTVNGVDMIQVSGKNTFSIKVD